MPKRLFLSSWAILELKSSIFLVSIRTLEKSDSSCRAIRTNSSFSFPKIGTASCDGSCSNLKFSIDSTISRTGEKILRVNSHPILITSHHKMSVLVSKFQNMSFFASTASVISSTKSIVLPSNKRFEITYRLSHW